MPTTTLTLPVASSHARPRAHSGGKISGGKGTRAEIEDAFELWKKQMSDNRAKKYDASPAGERRKMMGFILPLEDYRSSNMRLG